MQLGTLQEVTHEYVHDGESVALEGFTHLIPFAAGHEILRQKKRDLHLIRMTPDLIYDQLIGAGCARELTFSWGGNPGVGSLHRLRDAVENDWPQPLKIHEYSHAGMAAAYTAGASRLPFGMLRSYTGTDLSQVNAEIREVRCPYTNAPIATVPAINPDLTILHAQAADYEGNVLIRGIVGAQKEAALAARMLVVTVEELVESLSAPINSIVLPHWVVTAVAVVPMGAYPSYAHGYYARGNAFYRHWDEIARDRDTFTKWITRHVVNSRDHAEFLDSLAEAA